MKLTGGNTMVTFSEVWAFVDYYKMVILSVCAIVVAIIGIYLRSSRKGFTYYLESANLVVNVEERVADKVSIFYEDMKVENVHLIGMDMWNSGNQPIRDSDFVKSVSFEFNEDALILSVSIVEKEPSNLEPIYEFSGNKMELKPLLLNSGDKICLNILVSDWDSDVLEVDGRIVGVKEIKYERESSRLVILFYVMGIIFFFLTFFLTLTDRIVVFDSFYGIILSYIMMVLGVASNKKLRKRILETYKGFFFRSVRNTSTNKERKQQKIDEGEKIKSEIIKADSLIQAFPSSHWDVRWHKYTRDNSNPWGELLKKAVIDKINFDKNWGEDEVGNTGEHDHVGFRAQRTIVLNETKYLRFTIWGDDGVRLFVYKSDMTPYFGMTEGWKDQGYTMYQRDELMGEGEYRLRLEWYENAGAARVSFNVGPPE